MKQKEEYDVLVQFIQSISHFSSVTHFTSSPLPYPAGPLTPTLVKMHLPLSFLIRDRSLQHRRAHLVLRELLHSDRLHDARFFVHGTDASLPRDFGRRASPVSAVVQFQVAIVSRLGRDRCGRGRGVIVIVPLPYGLGDSSYRHQASEAVSRAASARSVAATPAGSREVELRGDLGGKVPEEVRHREQRAARDARSDFRHTERERATSALVGQRRREMRESTYVQSANGKSVYDLSLL